MITGSTPQLVYHCYSAASWFGVMLPVISHSANTVIITSRKARLWRTSLLRHPTQVLPAPVLLMQSTFNAGYQVMATDHE